MDINDFRGLITLVMLVAFLGLVRWAWHTARKSDFERAASLPLAADDRPLPPQGAGDEPVGAARSEGRES